LVSRSPSDLSLSRVWFLGSSSSSLRPLLCMKGRDLSYRYPLLQSLCLPIPARYPSHRFFKRCGSCPSHRAKTAEAIDARDSNDRAPLLRFCSLQRKPEQGARSSRDSNPGTFRSQGFAPSQRFASPCSCPGLFHPGTLLGFALQSLPFRESRNASQRPVPSCRSPPRSSPWRRAPVPPGPGPDDSARCGFRGFFSPGVRSLAVSD